MADSEPEITDDQAPEVDASAQIAAQQNQYIADRRPVDVTNYDTPGNFVVKEEHLDKDLWSFIEAGGSNVLAMLTQVVRNTHKGGDSE